MQTCAHGVTLIKVQAYTYVCIYILQYYEKKSKVCRLHKNNYKAAWLTEKFMLGCNFSQLSVDEFKIKKEEEEKIERMNERRKKL